MNQEKNTRSFGVEIEVNAFSENSKGKVPDGAEYIVDFIANKTKDKTIFHRCKSDHNNNYWVVKPDSSCGLEICTPVLNGELGIKKIHELIGCISSDEQIKSDERCSFHIHFDVSDLEASKLASIICWWIKSEFVFFNAIPDSRKTNQFCKMIGLSNDFKANSFFKDRSLIKKLGKCKYNSMNTFHMCRKKRNTIEFRIVGNNACSNPVIACNWIKLFLFFLNRSLMHGVPKKYTRNDVFSGYCWLDLKSFFDFMGFDDSNLNEDAVQIRNWFCEVLKENIFKSKESLNCIFDKKTIDYLKKEIVDLCSKYL
jgi:hypothetical protein